MKFLFIVSQFDSIKPHKDTSYFLMLGAHERQHEVYYCEMDNIYTEHDHVFATASKVTPKDNEKPSIDKSANINLSDFDVVWIRTDPPFDREYFYKTLLLDLVDKSTRILNPPSLLRDWNEKLSALKFPDITPETHILRNNEQIFALLNQHPQLVLKPIDGFAGKGIEFIHRDDDKNATLETIDKVTHQQNHWIVVQPFIKEADLGDKRVLILNGEPIGAILRLHAEGQKLNNLDAGGKALDTEITESDLKICQQIQPYLVENNVFFCGIDIIGDKLIEINVTSPTGLKELSTFKQHNFHHDCIKALEK